MSKRPWLFASISAIGLLSAVNPAWADNSDDLKAQIRELTSQLRAQIDNTNALTAQLKALEAQQVKLEQQVEANGRDAGSKTAAAQPAPAGPPGSFLIPGTNTAIKIGGYVKADLTDDLSGANLNGSAVDLQSIPLDGTPQAKRRNNINLTARQSRLNVGTETPTDYGPLKAFVEGDFYGSGSSALETNSAAFRFRHAYMSLGPVLAGQTWTVFDDVEVAPETLDFGGPAGIAYGIRQGQFRYTMPIGTTGSLALSVENPEGDFFGADHGSFVPAGSQVSTRVLNQVPDLAARYVHKEPWGRFSLSGLVREINLDTGGAAQSFPGPNGNFNFQGHATAWGGGVMATAQFPTFGKDTLTLWGGGGPGLGRYMLQLQDEAFTTGQAPNGLTNNNPGNGAALSPNGELHDITSVGGNIWYRHYWTDSLRSNATFGYVHYNNPMSAMPVNVTKELESLHVNLIWSPVPQTNFGVEYIYGYIGLDGQTAANKALRYGTQGTLNRIQFSAQYIF